MTLSTRILVWLASLLIAAGVGWGAHARHAAAQQARLALQQSEDARETERLQAQHMTRIANDLTSQRLAAVRDAAGLRDRLREQSATGASSATIAACRGDDSATGARVLPERIGADLVGLMEQAEAVSARLSACQELVRGNLPNMAR